MEIHKPKPWHSAQEFAKELLTIIAGIIIALSLETGVEHWHNQGTAAHARSDMREELARNRSSLERMIEGQRQAIPKLGVLEKVLRDRLAGSPTTLPTGFSIATGFETLDTAAWDSAVASQATLHIRPDQLRLLSQAYSGSRALNSFESLAEQQWMELSWVAGEPPRASPSDLQQALREVQRARNYGVSLLAASRELAGQYDRALEPSKD